MKSRIARFKAPKSVTFGELPKTARQDPEVRPARPAGPAGTAESQPSDRGKLYRCLAEHVKSRIARFKAPKSVTFGELPKTAPATRPRTPSKGRHR